MAGTLFFIVFLFVDGECRENEGTTKNIIKNKRESEGTTDKYVLNLILLIDISCVIMILQC